MRFQSILKRALWGGLVSLSIVGSPTPGWAATTEKAMLTQIQEQLIGFRQDLKQSIAQKQEDQQKIYANLKNKVNELTTGMATGRAARAEIYAKIQALVPDIEQYEAQIQQLDESLTAMETTMTTNLDNVAKQIERFKKYGGKPPTKEQVMTAQMEQPGFGFSPGQLFRVAYRSYMEGDYDIAIAGFQKFLADYANNELAGAAHYWIAEALMQLQSYGPAIQEYTQLINGYAQNEKVADAHYGIGVALLKLQRADEAKAKLTYVVQQFRGTMAAKKAQSQLITLP